MAALLPQPRPLNVGPKAMLPLKLFVPELNDTELLPARVKRPCVADPAGEAVTFHELGSWLMLLMPKELPSVICTGTEPEVLLVICSVVPLCAIALPAHRPSQAQNSAAPVVTLIHRWPGIEILPRRSFARGLCAGTSA